MNKLAVAVTLVSVLIGLVAISDVGANFVKKHSHKYEGGEVHKPHHVQHHHGHRGHEVQHKGPHFGPGPKCNCPKYPSCSGGHRQQTGGFGGSNQGVEHHHEVGEHSHEGGNDVEGRRGNEVEGRHGSEVEGRRGSEVEGRRGGEVEGRRGSEVEGRRGGDVEGRRGGDVEGRRGSFKGAGFGSGFKANKEFDAGVRAEDRERDRNQFQKHQAAVVGEQENNSGGESSSDASSVEGVHKRKNVNNSKVFSKETNRGNEDVEGFRAQNGHTQENHFNSGESKFAGAENDELGSSDHENERDFEAGVHKKDEVEGFSGAGFFKGQGV